MWRAPELFCLLGSDGWWQICIPDFIVPSQLILQDHSQTRQITKTSPVSALMFSFLLFRKQNLRSFVAFFFFFFLFFCCPIICANLRGTVPAPLILASPTSGHTQGSFHITAPPHEAHKRRRQIVVRLPSKGNTALLLSHFSGVQ